MARIWWPCYDTLVYDLTLSNRGIIDRSCRFWRFLTLHMGGMSENLEVCNVISVFDATCGFFAFKLFIFLGWGTCPLFDVIRSAAKVYFVRPSWGADSEGGEGRGRGRGRGIERGKKVIGSDGYARTFRVSWLFILVVVIIIIIIIIIIMFIYLFIYLF